MRWANVLRDAVFGSVGVLGTGAGTILSLLYAMHEVSAQGMLVASMVDMSVLLGGLVLVRRDIGGVRISFLIPLAMIGAAGYALGAILVMAITQWPFH